jgi:iron(III) transport system substrate-binding protein
MNLPRREFLRLAAKAVTLPALTSIARAEPYPSRPVRIAALADPTAITPALIEGARKEGKVNFYTALDLQVSEKLGKTFEARYPGIAARIERSGAERVFQRINQERASRISNVDVACSTDAAHFLFWKRSGWLAPYLPMEATAHVPIEHIDPDGMYTTVCAWLIISGYNTKLVKPQDAPKSFADLLDPKWTGKMVKAHPAYSGGIMTATFLMVREFGWDYLEKLAKQRIMQVQSSVDPPRKILLGERAVMVDGTDYSIVQFKEQGQPVEAVYAAEGTPLITVPSGVFHDAPNPNAARLFQSFLFSLEAQQLLADTFALRSFHSLVKDKPGRTPLSAVKLMKSDPAAVEAQSEEIKSRYSKLFGV